jgi:hypothetical protein
VETGASRREAAERFEVSVTPARFAFSMKFGISHMRRMNILALGAVSQAGCGDACRFRKSYPDVMVVQPGQDWDGNNDP